MARRASQRRSGSSLISANNILVSGGVFNQQLGSSREVLEILYPHIDTDLLHDSKTYERISSLPIDVASKIDAEFQEIMQWSTRGRLNSAPSVLRRDFRREISEQSSRQLALKVSQELSRQKVLLASIILPPHIQFDQHKVISTFAFQMALSIPSTQQYIMEAIKDPSIFDRNTATQIQKLIEEPLMNAASFASPSEKRQWASVVVIDGSYDQVASDSVTGCIATTLHNLSRKDLGLTFCLLLNMSVYNSRSTLISFDYTLQGHGKLPRKVSVIVVVVVVFD